MSAIHTPSSFDLQGHRGARGLRPENTIPAFLCALELGLPTVEMDVVISADEQVIVSHDPWMDATICSTPDGSPVPKNEARSHNIFEMPSEKVVQYDCGRRPHPDFPEQKSMPASKPLLREVIQKVEEAGREQERAVFYNIEIKSRPRWQGTYHPDPKTFARLVYDEVVDQGVRERTILQSFDPRVLKAIRSFAKPVRIALLVSQQHDQGIDRNLEWLDFTPSIYGPDYRLVDEELITQAHDRGMQVIPWTVNARSDMEQLARWGVDGLITDYPDRGLFLLE